MTIELRPLGEACNLACTYCYQEPLRLTTNNKKKKYDIGKMIEEAKKTGQEFSLFGGEILLIPKKDLEEFFKAGYELHGKSSMQTNGSLIDDEHIRLFKKYNVGIGLSIDGPNDLNSLRIVRSKKPDVEEKTLETTKKITENIMKLANNDLHPGIIITLHRKNGVGENLDKLLAFMRWLGDIGIKDGNIHALELAETMPDQAENVLTQKENASAFLKIAEFLNKKENLDLRYAPFTDIERIMKDESRGLNCTWRYCDPMNTQAVYGIEGDGGLSNCGRSNKEGIDFYKDSGNGYERYLSLYNFPDEHGGCNGCRFFLACNGSCPGEGEDYDLRNKTVHCYTQKVLLKYFEDKAKAKGHSPFSLRPDLKEVEQVTIEHLERGIALSINDAIYLVESRKAEQHT